MDRGAWWATVHEVAKSRTWLKWLSMQYLGERYLSPGGDCRAAVWLQLCGAKSLTGKWGERCWAILALPRDDGAALWLSPGVWILAGASRAVVGWSPYLVQRRAVTAEHQEWPVKAWLRARGWDTEQQLAPVMVAQSPDLRPWSGCRTVAAPVPRMAMRSGIRVVWSWHGGGGGSYCGGSSILEKESQQWALGVAPSVELSFDEDCGSPWERRPQTSAAVRLLGSPALLFPAFAGSFLMPSRSGLG